MLHLPDHTRNAMAIQVRALEPSDVGALGLLHRQACVERLEHRGGAALVAAIGRASTYDGVEETFLEHIGNPEFVVLVAELIDREGADEQPPEPLGHLVLRYGAQDSGTPEMAVIEELYVTPEARTIGLGSALLARARQLATEAGCTGLDAVALPGDRSTKNFFEDHSMVARAIIVHTELGVAEREAR